MTSDTIVQWVSSLTASPLGQLFILYLCSALVSMLLGRRSQIDAWAEAHPRLAALLKATRALGLDPWMFVQALSLAFRKRLPDALRPPEAPSKSSVRPPPLTLLALCLAALLVGCAATPEKPPCDAATLAGIVAECTVRVEQCAANGVLEADCEALTECDRRLLERAEVCS
jgi:hypothetical protein